MKRRYRIDWWLIAGWLAYLFVLVLWPAYIVHGLLWGD